jgi:hypothetical protein
MPVSDPGDGCEVVPRRRKLTLLQDAALDVAPVGSKPSH